MCLALKCFLEKHQQLNDITFKFGTPGHSAIQEVDNIHSHIEKQMKISELYSPLGFIRILKEVRLKVPMTIIQINSMHDYQSAASILKFSNVPFGRLKCLHLSHTLPFHVCYKLAVTESLYYEASILRTRRTEQILKVLPAVRPLNKKPDLSA